MIYKILIMKRLTFIIVLSLAACCLSSQCVSWRNATAEKSVPPQQKLEYPAFTTDEDIICHIGYTTSYNHTTLVPNWVAYELTDAEAAGELPRNDAFAQDEMCKGKQADLSDYKGSGWDRGHMAPAADMKWSEQAMLESFLLTNMCPQNHDCNAGCWERTEKMGRRIAKQYGKVYIVCGPVFTTHQYGTIGANQVAVPDAFFKAFLIESDGNYAAIGFMMKNSSEKQELKASSMSVDALEQLIGRDLFPNLPDDIENDIESKVVKKYWGI